MKSLLPELERQLVDAARRRHAGGHGASTVRHGRRRTLLLWLRRRPRGAVVLAAALLVSGSAAAAVVTLSGERSRPLSGTVHANGRSGASALVNYDIEIAPELDAGSIGWNESVSYRGLPRRPRRGRVGIALPLGLGVSEGGVGTAALGSPLFGAEAGVGGLWHVLTSPQVAAVRAPGGPTVLTRGDARLPYGFRAAVFAWPQAAEVGHFPGELTALDASGHVIPGHAYEQPTPEPTRFWQLPQPEPRGACSTAPRPGSSLAAQWGGVVTAIIPDPGILGHAFLSCVDTEYYLHGWPLAAAVLVDAKDPGGPPPELPNMTPIRGSPGLFDYAPAREPGFFRQVISLSARRVGNAWLVVQGGSGAAQRLQALRELSVGPIDLRPPALSQVPRNAVCAIRHRSLAGLKEVRQDYDVGFPEARRRRAPLLGCANAYFYMNGYALAVTVLAHAEPPLAAPRVPISGHRGDFTVAERGPYSGTWRRVAHGWVIVDGAGEAQRERLLNELSVTVDEP